MADSTTNYSIPKPTATDPPDVPADMGRSMDAIDVLFTDLHTQVDGAVYGNGSSGTVASGTALRCGQSDVTVILTTSFTLPEQQRVGFSGQARFDADASSGTVAGVALSVEIDGSVPANAWAGPMEVGLPGNASERQSLSIPYFTRLLSAGSHTVKLQADRDGAGVINCVRNASINGKNPNPTYLNVIT